VTEGSKVVTGQRLHSVGLRECLEKIGKEFYGPVPGEVSDWGAKLPYGRWVWGRGIACSFRSVKTPTVSAAYVKFDEDGSASIVTSTVEVGQGAHTILMQIAAEVLGVAKDNITVSLPIRTLPATTPQPRPAAAPTTWAMQSLWRLRTPKVSFWPSLRRCSMPNWILCNCGTVRSGQRKENRCPLAGSSGLPSGPGRRCSDRVSSLKKRSWAWAF
jgi:hypothetical protein